MSFWKENLLLGSLFAVLCQRAGGHQRALMFISFHLSPCPSIHFFYPSLSISFHPSFLHSSTLPIIHPSVLLFSHLFSILDFVYTLLLMLHKFSSALTQIFPLLYLKSSSKTDNLKTNIFSLIKLSGAKRYVFSFNGH